MKSLTVDLEHCYGIKRLKAEFDFTECGAYVIYAPNGVMKSSFARTFQDIADDSESRDRVFPHRTTRRVVTDEKGRALSSASVLVLQPYDEAFGNSEKTATLLVDAKLRKEYEQLYLDVDRAKTRFLDAMKKQSKSKRKLESEIALTFTKSSGDFYKALIRVHDEVKELPEPQFANVPYDLVADDKVATFLASHDVKDVLQDYINQYNNLLAQSKYFSKGTFDYHNASTIAKALASNGFFKAKHTVTLNADSKIEVKDEKQLAAVIAKEKATILKDAALQKTFDEMEKRITKNEMLREFQDFVADNKEVLALMGNLEKLKEDIWKSYFKQHEALYDELIQKYQSAATRGRQIEADAKRQRTQWEDVIDIFNQRFFVPFKLEVKNKVDVVLGSHLAPSLGFVFHEGKEQANIDRPDLLEVLSTGEKKALYILNVLFEIEVRRHAQEETVFVIDDIADSFDYKNKYAIIQYLKDVSRELWFKQLILTHNFDFFRTVSSRFVRYTHCRMVQRTASGLELVQATGIKNVFVNDWKRQFYKDGKKRIASISFIRNLVEYTRGEQDADYATLTALLHYKAETENISHQDLDAIYQRVFSGSGCWPKTVDSVVTTIRKEAKACLKAPEGTNFENKIVLAIAIRLEAERHMVQKIADPTFVAGITSNQTPNLLEKYRTVIGVDKGSIQTLDEVVLMTPENIHLNSFMYEPIIDMSDDHLRALFKKVQALT